MARDSLFGESIVWTGKPTVLRTPPVYRALAGAAGSMSVVSLLFALVVALALHANVNGMIMFAAWCAVLAVGAWRLPLVWQSRVEYIVTDKHVIWRRGPLRRTIDRKGISYARIHWIAPNVGDLVLVRAVPTGALRRTLTLVLPGVEAPDRLWAVVRGVEPTLTLGDGDRPLAQRLDEGELVLWTAIPAQAEWTFRRAMTALVAAALFGASAIMIARAVPPLRKVLGLHALGPAVSTMLVAGVALATLLVVVTATGVAHWAVLRPMQLRGQTRYFITNRRVLIRRGQDELYLDRSRIAYVIEAPVKRTQHANLFLVLDGPQARALAASGAFGERGDSDALVPVFASIDDAETASEILRNPRHSQPALHAA
ncbi:MAG TPA: hypothetical protein VH054_22320 [Polyangiaceae bacterium]|jgi:hypothetical protein|nr:hypothetical protein [Polyangiaceae bacterium]